MPPSARVVRRRRRRAAASVLLVALLSGVPALRAQQPAAVAPASHKLLTLSDLFSERAIADAALSPSGRYLASVLRRAKDDAILLTDLQSGERKILLALGHDAVGKRLDTHMIGIWWKTEDRLLFRLRIWPDPETRLRAGSSTVYKLGDRLFGINRDGTQLVRMLGENDNSALEGALNLGDIASILPKDPDHILMHVDGFDGRSLFRVNVHTGAGEQKERPSNRTVGWWLDVDGKAVVRVEIANGSLRFFRREADDKWKKYYSIRLREMREQPDYDPIGPSDLPGRYYVIARPPGRDRRGVYLYDIEKEEFGEPVIEHALYDLESAQISRDGKRVLRHCYVAHVRICEFADPRLNAHMKGIRKFFDENANVYVTDSSQDVQTILLYVEGPSQTPAYYYYRVAAARIEHVGDERPALAERTLPTAKIVNWKASDGRELSGYLTLPPAHPDQKGLPLLLYPHGGPEMRDHLVFDPWVQFFAARGYAVFQPNYRGSDGFGRAFAESGYGEWGRRMQDDLNEGVDALVVRGDVDPRRVCIVGASYGGYAALAGVALTPERYRCAVSVAGISDLDDFITFRKRSWGRDSDGYLYWLKAIGDPETDAARLREFSPAKLAARIKVPVLLIHGEVDGVVPIAQSAAMKKALDKAGRKTELIRLKDEGHSYWEPENELLALNSIDAFLWEHLGPGAGAPSAPEARKSKK